MRRPRQTLDQVVNLLAEGTRAATLSRTYIMCPSTVGRWREKTARHVRRFGELHDRVEDPVEVQIDEAKTYGIGRCEHTWAFTAIEVASRMWVAQHVGRRTLRSTRLFTRKIARVSPIGGLPWLVTSDDFKYYVPALRKSFGDMCVHLQVKNRYARGRIVRTRARLAHGSQARMEAAQRRSEDSKRPNTSYAERTNLTLRSRCSYMVRRTAAPVRNLQHLDDTIEIIRCRHNYVLPHSSLKFGGQKRTPAMQAGIFDRPLTLRQILSTVLPPRRTRVLDYTRGHGVMREERS
jgi:hypothetical protein